MAVRRSDFCAFAGESAANFQLRRRTGKLPFEVPDQVGAHHQFVPADFLAHQLAEALRAQGFGVKAAADALLASRAAPLFLEKLARGDAVAELLLADWREVEVTGEARHVVKRSAVLEPADVVELLASAPAPVGSRSWQRRGAGGEARESSLVEVVGPVSIALVPILPAWRAAIDRADAVGLDLMPGSVARKAGRDG